MLKMILISLEDFVLRQSGFLFNVLTIVAESINKTIDDQLTTEINKTINSKNQINVYEKLIDIVAKQWDIDANTLKSQLELQGKEIIETHSLTLNDEWINAFEEINNHQIQLVLISNFNINTNPFQNYDFNKQIPKIISIAENADFATCKEKILAVVNEANIQLNEALLVTNRTKLFELSKAIGLKIFTTNEEIDKSYLKNQYVSQIDSNLNVESWIYQFLSETTDQFS